MNINVSLNHIESAWISNEIDCIVRNHIICKDGFEVSVQASKHHYFIQEKLRNIMIILNCIVIFLMIKILLESYYDGTICAYVPKAIVEILILRHGSINWNLTPRKEK